MTDIPIDSLAVGVQEVLVERYVPLESRIDDGVGKPGLFIEAHTPMLMQHRIGAADGGGVVITERVLLHGDGIQPRFGAGKRRCIPGGTEPADHHVHVMRGNDPRGVYRFGLEGDFTLTGGIDRNLLDHRPYRLARIKRLHASHAGGTRSPG